MIGNGKTYHRWTPQMEKFLIRNYRYYGDLILAQMMNDRFPHRYRWNIKHIEKKRGFLGLKRTKEEVFAIRSEWAKVYAPDRLERMWEDRNKMKIGEVRKWGKCEYVMTKRGVVSLHRYTWMLNKGKIKKGYNVVIKDHGKSAGDINNLELVSDAELAKRNSIARYPPELRKAIWALIKFNKAINEKHSRPTGNTIRRNPGFESRENGRGKGKGNIRSRTGHRQLCKSGGRFHQTIGWYGVGVCRSSCKEIGAP